MAAKGVRVEFKGLDKAKLAFMSLSSDYPKWAKDTMQKAADFTLGKLPKYPSSKKGPYPFVSKKQRAFVAALMQTRGRYRRTGQMGRSLTADTKPMGGDVVGLIGTNMEYAAWVISSEPIKGVGGPQSEYHKGHWWTLQEEVKKHKDEIVDIIVDELNSWIERKF